MLVDVFVGSGAGSEAGGAVLLVPVSFLFSVVGVDSVVSGVVSIEIVAVLTVSAHLSSEALAFLAALAALALAVLASTSALACLAVCVKVDVFFAFGIVRWAVIS